MIILGIDPGPEKSAYVVWDTFAKKIIDCDIQENEQLITNNFMVDLLAIEVPKIFGNKVWQQVIDTSFVAGYITGKLNLPFTKVAPNDWKLYITGKRGASDQLVRQALMARFGSKGTKKNPGILYRLKTHLWDSFAIAIYAGDIIKEINYLER